MEIRTALTETPYELKQVNLNFARHTNVIYVYRADMQGPFDVLSKREGHEYVQDNAVPGAVLPDLQRVKCERARRSSYMNNRCCAREKCVQRN